jgi:ABC-type polysaccharide/polyol phosphate transport system ATPase subunit
MATIRLESVSLSYPIYSAGSRSLKKSLMSVGVGGVLKFDTSSIVNIQALDTINLTLAKGDRLGLVGHNGAGKSSLLKLIAGIYTPTSGVSTVKGRVSSLLNIGLGMDDYATGYENIYLSGMFLGLSRKQITTLLPGIVEFCELGDYLSMPIRTYSAGMRVRLAFAISTSIEPEILLMDEVMGVGDAHFIDKATQRLNNVVNKASILVLASHSDKLIREMCNKAVWLEHGKVVLMGSVDDVLAAYAERHSG